MKRFCAGSLMVMVIVCQLSCDSGPGKRKTDTVGVKGGKTQMNVLAIKDKVLNDDWSVLDDIETLTDRRVAVSPLWETYRHCVSAEGRVLVVRCLGSIRDTASDARLLEALTDADQQVRTHAFSYLKGRYNPGMFTVIIHCLEHGDPVTRGAAAELLASSNEQRALAPLKKMMEKEAVPETMMTVKLALARLGDRDAKYEFVAMLRIDDPKIRYEAIEYLRYIGDCTLCSELLPVLSDFGRAHIVSDKSSRDPARYARVCDAAVTLTAALCGHKFTFETDDFVIYTNEQIEEARSYIRSISTEPGSLP
jgi:hypothetical protein